MMELSEIVSKTGELKTLLEMNTNDDRFQCLTADILLYRCVRAIGIDKVYEYLEETDFDMFDKIYNRLEKEINTKQHLLKK